MVAPGGSQLGAIGDILGALVLGALGSTAQTITPDAPIPSSASWPSPVVAGALSSATIPSHASWPTPEVESPITIVCSIPRHQFWFTPALTGPLVPDQIPSQASWPTPRINLEQRILPAAPIPTHVSWPTTARVAHTLTIRPAAPIPTHSHWFTPSVRGAGLFINVVGIPARRSWKFPTLTGGDTAASLRLYIGGIERTHYLETYGSSDTAGAGSGGGGGGAGPPVIASQTIGRWTAQFDLFDDTNSFAPALGQTVVFTEGGRRLFAGCLRDVKFSRFMSTSQSIVYHCLAVDKSGICDQRRVTGRTYPRGSDGGATILDIVASYLNGEGITTNGVPLFGVLGDLDNDIPLNFTTVTNAFDQIATSLGCIWWIDVLSDLHFSPFADLEAAPFELTETSGNWRNLNVDQTLLDYRNKQYAVSNLNALPGASSIPGGGGVDPAAQGITEVFTWANDEPGIRSGFDPTIGDTVPLGLRVSLPIGKVISLTCGSDVQTVVDFAQFSGQTSSGPADFLWFFLGPGGTGLAGLDISPQLYTALSGPGPAHGTTITVVYVPYTSSAAVQTGEALDATPAPGAPTGGTLGTCGSGIYEAVETVKDISTVEDLTAIAQAVLIRRGGVPTVIDFETDFPGLAPGQLLTIDIPGVWVPDKQLLITSVVGTWHGSDLGHGSGLRWVIKCQSNQDPGNWVKWYERLLARTENSFPVFQYEVASFILAPGSNLAGGAAETNPYIVKRTGQLFDMHAAAHVPPVDQDLILTAYVNGIPLDAHVTIAAGSTPDTDISYTFPLGTPLYVFSRPGGVNDIITVAASYRQTGAGPVPAGSVSFDVRFRM